MALSLPFPIKNERPMSLLTSDFLPLRSLWTPKTTVGVANSRRNLKRGSICSPCSSMKIVRSPVLDKHVKKQNKIRFVQKLKTLLLSKPKHFMPLHILAKCRSYLALPKPRSIRSMIHCYPTIFELFTIPFPPTPLNAAKTYPQVCVRLTPEAEALAVQESKLKSAISTTLATKLQKLLMLSTHHRILLSKLVHLGPDLGLPPNFRSRLCNDHPDKFKTIDTSYGRALELVKWNADLANPIPSPGVESLGLIVDRPLKFKHLRLRKGLNVKRCHHDFLVKFRDMPDICPYKTQPHDLEKESLEAEKRACAVVREVMGMMVEKRTLVDHLTHFRKDFGLPNRLHAMLVRHPELFYVSLKGLRDSVFLVEAFDNKGELLEKDETLVFKNRLLQLVQEGKEIRRERRKNYTMGTCAEDESVYNNDEDTDGAEEECIDSFEDLFACDDFILEDDDDGDEGLEEDGEFWLAEASSTLDGESKGSLPSW